MFKNKLIKLSSTEHSGQVRYKENEPVECNIDRLPSVGEPIIAIAKSLTDFGDNLNQIAFRNIITSYVTKIEDNLYTTETGSVYKILTINPELN